MIRRPPRSTRTYTLLPYTTRFRSIELVVGARLDVAAQPDLGLAQHLVQRLDDPLDARVVGRDAVADQAERRGLALVEVDRSEVQTSELQSLMRTSYDGFR